MDYIHVKSLEKFHPKYKDRTLQWAKIYFKMIQGDPETEMLHEIDRGRLISFILLELQAKEPIPNNDEYFRRKGFAIEIRPMSLTLQMLHNFVICVDEEEKVRYIEKEIEEEKEIEKDIIPQIEALLKLFSPTIQTNIKVYIDRAGLKNKSKVITDGRRLTMLNELYNAYQRCNDQQLFSYALETATKYDAPNIGYINAVIKNKKTEKPK